MLIYVVTILKSSRSLQLRTAQLLQICSSCRNVGPHRGAFCRISHNTWSQNRCPKLQMLSKVCQTQRHANRFASVSGSICNKVVQRSTHRTISTENDRVCMYMHNVQHVYIYIYAYLVHKIILCEHNQYNVYNVCTV